jgi:tetratricopeptide (TPR) repeat protein
MRTTSSPRAAAPTAGLNEERIAAYLRGDVLDPAERAALEAAIDREPHWLAVVALLARREPGSDPVPAQDAATDDDDDDDALARVEREHALRLQPGRRVGRYEIEGPLGRGGMGVVYAAFDPELGRRVAIKILRGDPERTPTREDRLLREARALARLSDGHVITINDVGTWQGRVFLAMELLEGPTLQAWRATGEPTWQEILAVYIDAGRGLAAAHAVGLVHRDFKPANVMFDADGRVVVLDFGLARGIDTAPASMPDAIGDAMPDAIANDAAPSTRDPTRTGAVLGTPAYMAPEQRRGEPCTAAADQFSYCVALSEALRGSLPEQAASGSTPSGWAPARGRWPRRLDRLLARGLAAAPQDRHPSMAALVDALAGVLRPRHTRRLAAIVGGSGIAALAIALVDRAPPCTGAEVALAATFDEARAEQVAAALLQTERPWSARTRDEVDRRLHDYAQAWIEEHGATCRATHIDGVQSETVLDLRMACLDRRRRSLGAVLDVLEVADDDTAAQAVRAVEALPQLTDCRDVEALAAPVPVASEGEDRRRAEALFDQLARVEALREANHPAEATALARAAVVEAVALGHAPSEADARLALGWALHDEGEHDAAEAELRAALHAAEAGGHDEAAVLAWTRLGWVVGCDLARHDEGRRELEHAAVWSRRLRGRPHLEVARLRTLGWIEHEAGDDVLAIGHFEAALTVAEELPPGDRFGAQEVAMVLNGLGAAQLGAAQLDRAEASFTRAAAQLEAELGPDHPDVARTRNNLGALLRAQGRAEESRAVFLRTLAVFEGSFGSSHPVVGQTLVNLAVAELDLGEDRDAEAHAERAIAVLTAAHGPRHPMVAKAHTIRGDARIQLERPLEAIADLELALDVERETLGPTHPSVGIIESNLGGAYYDLARHAEADVHLRRAREILETSLGADHPNVAFVLVSLGLSRRAQGHPEEALGLFERAATIADATLVPGAVMRAGETLLALGRVAPALEHLERARAMQLEIETAPGLVGDTCFALARARWASGERRAAHDAATTAIDAFTTGGVIDSAQEVRRWMATHR